MHFMYWGVRRPHWTAGRLIIQEGGAGGTEACLFSIPGNKPGRNPCQLLGTSPHDLVAEDILATDWEQGKKPTII